MSGTLVCIAATLLGVDARMTQLPDGGVQYVIQVEPQVLERLESGAIETVASYVPRDLNDIRAYQIVIGTRNTPPTNVQTRLFADENTEWISLPTGGVECRVWIEPEILGELQKPGRVIEGNIPADMGQVGLFTIAVGTKPPTAIPPVVADPVVADPVVADPIVQEPIVQEPVMPEPIVAEPIAVPTEPAVISVEPPWPSLEPTAQRSPAEPFVLDPPTDSTMISAVKTASHVEQPEEKPRANSILPAKVPTPGTPTQWPPWATVTLFGLVASLAGNMFLLWIIRDFRSQYRALRRRMGEVGSIVRGRVVELEGLPPNPKTK